MHVFIRDILPQLMGGNEREKVRERARLLLSRARTASLFAASFVFVVHVTNAHTILKRHSMGHFCSFHAIAKSLKPGTALCETL